MPSWHLEPVESAQVAVGNSSLAHLFHLFSPAPLFDHDPLGQGERSTELLRPPSAERLPGTQCGARLARSRVAAHRGLMRYTGQRAIFQALLVSSRRGMCASSY